MNITGIHNIRGLGGHPTQTGITTQSGVFIRASNMDNVPREAQNKLLAMGVMMIVDLRDEIDKLRSTMLG